MFWEYDVITFDSFSVDRNSACIVILVCGNGYYVCPVVEGLGFFCTLEKKNWALGGYVFSSFILLYYFFSFIPFFVLTQGIRGEFCIFFLFPFPFHSFMCNIVRSVWSGIQVMELSVKCAFLFLLCNSLLMLSLMFYVELHDL